MFKQIIWNMTGDQIEQESFRRIDAEVAASDRDGFNDSEWHVARRLVHTSADFGLLRDLRFRHDPIRAGLEALRRGAPIYSDSNMIKAGLSVPKLQKFNPGYQRDSIYCYIADPDVAAAAREQGATRALAAVRKGRNIIDGGIFLCGNAPLALAEAVRMVVEEGLRPALIVGMPVGFVNVVEAKELLCQIDIPHITIEGRRGGSPLAVAALHGIMELC